MAKKSITVLKDQALNVFHQIDKKIWHGKEEELLLGGRIFYSDDGHLLEGLFVIMEDLSHWNRTVDMFGRAHAKEALRLFEKAVVQFYKIDRPVGFAKEDVEAIKESIFKYPATRKNWDDAECKQYVKKLSDYALCG
jgi:hypothetical protein